MSNALIFHRQFTASRAVGDDEYFNPVDGLIHCRKCCGPRQCRHEVLGKKVILPNCLCICQQEKLKKAEEEENRREQLRQIRHLKAEGLKDPMLYDYNFSNDSGFNPQIRHAHTFVDSWDLIKERGTGLLLWGDVGTGKTFFAGCIANALIAGGVPVLMTNFPRVLNALTGMYPEERNRFADDLNHYSLLILDDLGVERNSEFALEQIFNVIDSRYRSKKPLIVTTNLTLDELKHPEDLAHARIYDRILERCVPLRINGRDIRAARASEALQEAKKLFLGSTGACMPQGGLFKPPAGG